MSRRTPVVVAIALVVLAAQAKAETQRRWVAAAAHAPGDAGRQQKQLVDLWHPSAV